MASFKAAGRRPHRAVDHQTTPWKSERYRCDSARHLCRQERSGPSGTRCKVPANSSRVVWRAEPPHIITRPITNLLVRSPLGRFPPNRHFSRPSRTLLRPAVRARDQRVFYDDHELSGPGVAPNTLLLFTHRALTTHPLYRQLFRPGRRRRPHHHTDQHKIRLAPDMVSFAWR